MSFKSYKLIPIDDYEKMKLYQPVYPDTNEEMDHKDDGNTSNRNIQNIIKDNLEHTEFKPSTHYVADSKLSIQKGGGGKIPIFLPDTGELPQFSRGMRLQKSYDDLSTVLNDNTIPDDLKIKLYTILKRKYDINRKTNPSNNDVGGDKHEERNYNADETIRSGNHAIDSFPNQEKRSVAREIVNILLKRPEFVSWNSEGNLIRPNNADLSLYRFLEIMIYRKKGLKEEIEKIANAIKPLTRELTPYIVNAKLKQELEKNIADTRFSKYVSWM